MNMYGYTNNTFTEKWHYFKISPIAEFRGHLCLSADGVRVTFKGGFVSASLFQLWHILNFRWEE